MNNHEPMNTEPRNAAAGAKKQMAALESMLAPLFAKAPHLPKNWRDFLVQIAPWLALIFGVLGVIGILSAGAFTSYWAPYFPGYGFDRMIITIGLLASFIASVLNIMAWKPLGERKKKGWNFLFYGLVLTTIAGLLEIFVGYVNLGSVIGAIIGFWLLFEIRSHYHA